MQCPHCNQEVEAAEEKELELIECESCGQSSLDGANYCFNCGQSFNEEEAAEQEAAQTETQECSQCGREVPVDDNYCADCGQSMNAAPKPKAKGKAPKKRVACSDGMCIGIIGPDGKCTECGKPYQD